MVNSVDFVDLQNFLYKNWRLFSQVERSSRDELTDLHCVKSAQLQIKEPIILSTPWCPIVTDSFQPHLFIYYKTHTLVQVARTR